MPSPLFTPIALREVTLANRIVVSPMCQYSAEDGSANDWHLLHLGSLAVAGAGLLMIEATAVETDARNTLGCLGLYSDANEAVLRPVVAACRRFGNAPLGIQLAHAGRKASATRPWQGIRALTEAEGGWQPVAPSPLPLDQGWPAPQALTFAELAGGAAVFGPARGAGPSGKPLGARITGTDWLEGGVTVDEAVVFAQALKRIGCDYVCVSSGGIVPKAPIPIGPGYQLALAERVRRDGGLPTRAVGLIAAPPPAEAIVA